MYTFKLYPSELETHMYPSRRDWEKALYESKAMISDQEMEQLFDQ